MAGSPPLRLGISRCLLGDPVRYDGGHKRNEYLVEVLGRQIEWVPICPEVEAGLGTPREPMQLAGSVTAPRLVTIKSKRDLTTPFKQFSTQKLRELDSQELSGCVFKARSPSCGVEVPVYGRKSVRKPHGMGLFVRAFRKRFPLIPIADEAQLSRPESRDGFLSQVFGYHRWCRLTKRSVTIRALVRFHRSQSDLLAACRPERRRILDDLIERAGRYGSKQLVARYGSAFMHALRSRAEGATRKKRTR